MIRGTDLTFGLEKWSSTCQEKKRERKKMPLPKAGNPLSTLKWCSLQFRISTLPTVCFAADVFFLNRRNGMWTAASYWKKKSHYDSRVLKTKVNKGKRSKGGTQQTTASSLQCRTMTGSMTTTARTSIWRLDPHLANGTHSKSLQTEILMQATYNHL